jgi:hypothetical protein
MVLHLNGTIDIYNVDQRYNYETETNYMESSAKAPKFYAKSFSKFSIQSRYR